MRILLIAFTLTFTLSVSLCCLSSQTSVGTFTLPRVNLLEWASHNDFPTLIKELSLSLSWLQMLCRE